MRYVFFFLLTTLSTTTFAQSYSYWLTGDDADVQSNHLSGIVLAGGGGDNDDAMQWMLERADGGDVVVIRASGSDGYNNYFFSDLSVNVNSVETILFNNADAANDPFVIQTIENAEVLFIAGGDQFDYYSYWKDTPIEEAINDLINEKGATVGGTSAGMAILGKAYYTPTSSGVISSEALSDPFHPFMDIIGHDDFVETPILANVITDTHYDQRNRKGRHLTFLARLAAETGEQYFGIACNEYTAVCINEMGQAIVFGEYPQYDDFAYFIQTNCQAAPLPEQMTEGEALHWVRGQSAVKAYKVGGATYGALAMDLNDWSNPSNGIWENWFVENGTLQIISDTNGDCADVLTSVETLPAISGISLSQNPVNAFVTINNQQNVVIDSATIINGQAKSVWSGKLERNIDVSHLPKGLYYLSIYVEGGAIQLPFVKS